eukprot:gene2993-3738_t
MQAKTTAQLVKGTRDFNATQVTQRRYIFDTIQDVYRKYGFLPLETPAIEYASTLLGQYGEEGENLVFRILDSGNFLSNTPPDTLAQQDHTKILPTIAEKALRYDLTVPFMRYIATHYQEIALPFKRYQIQPVWRADRPQKGRYREFYQCDADVVGSSSLLLEAEILAMVQEVLFRLGIHNFVIHLNHRAILNGIAAQMGALPKVNELCTIIDKLDKIGKAKVMDELLAKGFTPASLSILHPLLDSQESNEEKLNTLHALLKDGEVGNQGLQDLMQIFQYLEAMGLQNIPINFSPSLARGLSYYTGAIWEIKLPALDLGSIAGGGRYDQLAEHFGIPPLTGVGFSFGVDRLYLAMEQLGLFPKATHATTQVMFTNLEENALQASLRALTQVRNHHIAAEMYPEVGKLKKQLTYANKKHIPYVVIVGQEELQANRWVLKDMQTGDQVSCTLAELLGHLDRESNGHKKGS